VTVPFSTLARGLASGVREPTQVVVIRSRDDWVALWGRLSTVTPESAIAAQHIDDIRLSIRSLE